MDAFGNRRHQLAKPEQEYGGASMKKQVFVTLAALSGLIPLGAPPARAQSEIDPDHFASPNTEPFRMVKADIRSDVGTIRYDGKFQLAYAVECNGKSLGPGRYSVSLRSDGQVGWGTLHLGGQAIGIGGVVRRQVHKHGTDALIVEIKGTTRRLSAIQLAMLDFVLDPGPQLRNSVESAPGRLERLPLTQTLRGD